MLRIIIFAIVLFAFCDAVEEIRPISFCSMTSLRGPLLLPYSPITITGSSDVIGPLVNVTYGVSSCKCSIQTGGTTDNVSMSLSVSGNSRVKSCGKWIEVVKDGEATAHRFSCRDDTVLIAVVPGGTGITATLFVEDILDMAGTYDLKIYTDVVGVEVVVSCRPPILGEVTLPTAAIITTTTATSTLASRSSTVPTSTKETTHVMSDGTDSTVILVAVMVVVGVIVVVFIIVILLCINRRVTQRPIQSEQPPAARPHVFKRIGTRITHLYDSIKESNVMSELTGTRQLDTSKPMPLPKHLLQVKPSGRYDSIKSNTKSRIGTHGNKNGVGQQSSTHSDTDYVNPTDVDRTAVKVIVASQPSTESDKYYIHAENTNNHVGDSDVLNEADNRKLLANRNNHTDTYLNMHPAKHTHRDDSAYMSMDGNSIPEDEYVNPILKSKSVKYINGDGAKSILSEQRNILKMEQTAVGSTDDVYVNTNLHQNSQKDESIYLPMHTIDIDNETGNTAAIVHKTNVSNDRADQEQHGNAISELNVNSVENSDTNDTDVDDHYYTNSLVKSGKVRYVLGDIHHYEQDA